MNPYDPLESAVLVASSLQEGAKGLQELLSGGYAVWEDDSLYSIKQLVALVNRVKIEVFAREYPPPQFHLSGDGIDATFSVSDCTHLEGQIFGREKALVEWWFQRNRSMLVKAWNESRPSDCPVGPIAL